MLSILQIVTDSPWDSLPARVAARLGAAFLLGLAVSWIHRRTARGFVAMSFSVTLVLLTMLIAAVTEVIGDSVARAFSLVGALSIVRFRTVVQDTRDTVFVIFAVTAGMAAGVANFTVAAVTVVMVGLAAVIVSGLQRRAPGADTPAAWLLAVRTALGKDCRTIVSPKLDECALHWEVRKVGTTRSGASIETLFRLVLRPGVAPDALVNAIQQFEGVQFVEISAGDGLSEIA